jgi:uracil-DNA glycosylase
MNADREELLELARTLRAHAEYVALQGVTEIPAVEVTARGVGGETIARPAELARIVQEVAAVALSAPRSEPVVRVAVPSVPPAAVRASLLGGDAAVAAPSAEPMGLGERRTLAELREALGECTRCKLHETRTKIVYGVGSETAELMFVGEGPGHDEDLSGEPFVGKAGQLLTKIIGAMGLRREEVYIANVVKCRPPGNRDPEVDEVASCSPFLFAQLASIQPKVIVSLGRPACATLIGAPLSTPISKLRGKWLSYRGQIPIMPTFHPAYLLRTPAAKREVWEDMKQVVAKLEALTGRVYQLGGSEG